MASSRRFLFYEIMEIKIETNELSNFTANELLAYDLFKNKNIKDYQEIGVALGVERDTAYRFIKSLRQKGKLPKLPTTNKLVYLAKNEATTDLKIGISTNPAKRIKLLNTSSSHKISLIHIIKGSYETESYLHNLFKTLRLNGEWFKYDESILETFKNMNYD